MKPWSLLVVLLIHRVPFAQAQNGATTTDLAQVGGSLPHESVAPSASVFQEGILALKAERPKEAIGFLTRELAANPQNGKAWYYRGVCHLGLDEMAEALEDLDRALELLPNDANALLRRSEVHLARGSYAKAMADLDAVLSVHPTGPIAEHALMSMGEAHMRQGDHAAAIAVYDRFTVIAPDDARSWFNRGIAYAHSNEHMLAFSDLSKAIALDGWMYKAYAARAIELVHLDRKGEACSDLVKASELGDDSVDDLRAIYCE